ncbi:MAG: PEP-CTERM sorting domain-containing protein [Planctomycetota bacterium]
MCKKELIVLIAVVLGCVVLAKATMEDDLKASQTFVATYNNGFDADYARGSGTATVHSNPLYSPAEQVQVGPDGSGAFPGASPTNQALLHPHTGAQHDNTYTDIYVDYDGGGGNFSFSAGSYAAWSKWDYMKRGFTPAEGVIIQQNDYRWTPESLSLCNTYYYSYNLDFWLMGTDASSKTSWYATQQIPGTDAWVFTVATWQLIPDAGSTTGYRMDATMNVWNGVQWYKSGLASTMDVDPTFTPTKTYVGSAKTGWAGYGGYVDWVQIYDRPLSDVEITYLRDSTVEFIPEPATVALLGLGLLCIRRRK